MSSLSTIRKQLRAVENIKQITTSMEMVASARFKKAQEKAKQAGVYIAKLQEILEKIATATTDFRHPLFIQRPLKKSGVVIVASDRGLCGAYNATIFSVADRFLKERTTENVELYLLGKKAVQYYQGRKFKIAHEMIGWSGKITLAQVKAFSDLLVRQFLLKNLDSIFLIYTKFHTLMQREVVVEKFLPLGQPYEKSKIPEKKRALNYIFEPTIEELYEQLLPRYCMTKMETVFNQAYASELTSRIFSMKAAAKNAEEMLEHLSLEHNKIRQTQITRELLETTAFIREQQ